MTEKSTSKPAPTPAHTGSRPADAPTLARGTSPEAEPEREEDEGDDAALVEEGIAAADEAAEARELPAEAKAQQMTPEEYDAIGKGKDYKSGEAQPRESKTGEVDNTSASKSSTGGSDKG